MADTENIKWIDIRWIDIIQNLELREPEIRCSYSTATIKTLGVRNRDNNVPAILFEKDGASLSLALGLDLIQIDFTPSNDSSTTIQLGKKHPEYLEVFQFVDSMFDVMRDVHLKQSVIDAFRSRNE